MADLITSQAAIFDNGSGAIKCGFAGSDVPETIIPTILGRQKFQRTCMSALKGDGELIGQDARNHRGILQLRHPIKNGQITDWGDMEKIWQLCFSELGIQNPEDHPVLLTEAPLNPRANREKMCSVFFEQFGSPAVYASVQACLALYAAGKTSGLALDCGDGVCHALPMLEGFVVPYGVERSDIGGEDVNQLLRRLLRKSGYQFQTSAEIDIVRDIKESVCAINPKVHRNVWDAVRDMNNGATLHVGSKHFTLPDNTVIEVGSERVWAPETLFHPALSGKEDLGVHELVQVAISRSPIDSRATLWQNLALSGGSSLFSGFADRLLAECRRMTSKETRLRISAPPHRANLAFMGGSILASLPTFKKLWVTKKEYDEVGPHILTRKLAD